MDKADFQQYRRAVQIIHQDPYASLNPTQTVRQMIMTPLLRHQSQRETQSAGGGGRRARRRDVERRAAELLEIVDLTPVAEFLDKYPHQLSGDSAKGYR